MNTKSDTWSSGDPYEFFMGRWSRLMAPEFLKWLNLAKNLSWLDLGCGTGALSEAIIKNCKPAHLYCIEPSADFLAKAKERLGNKAECLIGTATNIPLPDNKVDIAVSGLALNFFPDLAAALAEMKRVIKPNGIIAAYVWDYSGKMEFLRRFWDAAAEVAEKTKGLDEGIRFPICNPDKLKSAFQDAELSNIETDYLTIETIFKDFEDYWNPFLGGQGPAPSYLASESSYIVGKIRFELQQNLPVEVDGSIRLLARAIAIRGTKLA